MSNNFISGFFSVMGRPGSSRLSRTRKWRKYDLATKSQRGHILIRKHLGINVTRDWHREVWKRGKPFGNSYYWTFAEVKSFCENREFVSAFLNSNYKVSIPWLQVFLWSSFNVYIHKTRRNQDNDYPWKATDHDTPKAYRNVLRNRIKILTSHYA